MKRYLPLLAAALLSASTPMTAASYLGGVEDYTGLDNDYNDTVFTISGTGVTLHSATGLWFNKPTLGTSGIPFWNNSSLDGPNDNVGYCIYGGGSCNGGVGLSPTAEFLAANATSKTGSANDVYFSASGVVNLSIPIQITAAKDVLGWYLTSSPGSINWFNITGGVTTFSFTPGADFGLALDTYTGGSTTPLFTYYSQSQYGSQDAFSHFAFFGSPASVAPEPGAVGLLGLGLAGIGVIARRRSQRQVK